MMGTPFTRKQKSPIREGQGFLGNKKRPMAVAGALVADNITSIGGKSQGDC
jgi:hypothetical protein